MNAMQLRQVPDTNSHSDERYLFIKMTSCLAYCFIIYIFQVVLFCSDVERINVNISVDCV